MSDIKNTCYDVHKALDFVKQGKISKFDKTIEKMYAGSFFRSTKLSDETIQTLQFLATLSHEYPEWHGAKDTSIPSNENLQKALQKYVEFKEAMDLVMVGQATVSTMAQVQQSDVATSKYTNTTNYVPAKVVPQALPSSTILSAHVIPNENPFAASQIYLSWNALAPSSIWNYYLYKNGKSIAQIDSNMVSYYDVVSESQRNTYGIGTKSSYVSNTCVAETSMKYCSANIVDVLQASECIVQLSTSRPIQNSPFAITISHKQGLSIQYAPFISVSCDSSNVEISQPSSNEQKQLVYHVQAEAHASVVFSVAIAQQVFTIPVKIELCFDISKASVSEIPQNVTKGTKLLIKVLYSQEDFDMESKLCAKLATKQGTETYTLARANQQTYFVSVPLDVEGPCHISVLYNTTQIKETTIQVSAFEQLLLPTPIATPTKVEVGTTWPSSSPLLRTAVSIVNYLPNAQKIIGQLKSQGMTIHEQTETLQSEALFKCYLFFCYPNLSPNFEDYRSVLQPLCARGKPVIMVLVCDSQSNPDCKQYFHLLPNYDFPTKKVLFWDNSTSGMQEMQQLLSFILE